MKTGKDVVENLSSTNTTIDAPETMTAYVRAENAAKYPFLISNTSAAS